MRLNPNDADPDDEWAGAAHRAVSPSGDRARRTALAAASVAMLLGLVALLAQAFRHERWPLGHPWVELALLAAAGNLALHAARPDHVPSDAPRFYAAGAALVAPLVPLLGLALAGR